MKELLAARGVAVLMASLLLVVFAASARADGKVFPKRAVSTAVEIPDQRALIVFHAGTQRLVIETSFAGEGHEFAWIVPLPAVPVVEPASAGLFNTLTFQFAPKVVNEHYRFHWALLGLAAVLLCGRLASGRRSWLRATLWIGVTLGLATNLLPFTLSGGGSSGGAQAHVVVHERQTLGSYDVATISSASPGALLAWLEEHDFATPPEIEPVVAEYVREGWVFVAARLRRPAAGEGPMQVHPLSFTFPAEQAVYPLRLTGAGAEMPCHVELYVFGAGRAEAPPYEVERCDLVERRALHDRGDAIPVLHPLLARWVPSDATVATKLSAKLTPEQMRRDTVLEWVPLQTATRVLYTPPAALNSALQLAAFVLFGGLLFVLVRVGVFHAQAPAERPAVVLPVVTVLLAAGSFGAGFYVLLPKITDYRLLGHSRFFAQFITHDMREFARSLPPEPSLDVTALRARFEPFRRGSRDQFTNPFTGGPIREEDSPGNYVLEQRGPSVLLGLYGEDGRPAVVFRLTQHGAAWRWEPLDAH